MKTEGAHNVVVEATPRFAPEHSDPKQGRWIFIYRIRIENQSDGEQARAANQSRD